MTDPYGQDHDHDDRYARERHGHDYAEPDHRHDGSDVRQFGALAALVAELGGGLESLRARVRELETDRAAMIRRMRQLEETLSIPPTVGDLTAADPAPFPLDVTEKGPHGTLGRLPVVLDELDDQDPKEP